MRVGRWIGKTAGRFGGDRRGNFGMMLAVTAPLLALAAGYGLNIAQMSMTRSNLLAALDSAITSTARDLTTGAIAEDQASDTIRAFLLANGVRGFAAEDRISLDSVVVDKDARTVSATASVVIDVAFPLFGIGNQQKITSDSAAVYSDRKIEVAMMLDLTTSMRGQKLRDLKTAAGNAVDALLGGQDPSKARVRVAMVPYSHAVNVGRSIAEQAVFVETASTGRVAEPPANDVPFAVATRPDYCATERKGAHRISDAGPHVAMVNRDLLLDDFAAGYRMANCPVAEIVPLTANAATLTGTIGRFVADGATGGHIGIQWTWYMLSEKWRNVVGSAAAAAPHDPKKVGKYAILMTDGEFTAHFEEASNLGEVFDMRGKEPSMRQAKDLCEAMRADGIEVFTIGFRLENEAARGVMRDCASPDRGETRHFFDTANGEQLNAAFMEIVRNIERLALTR